MDGTKWKGRTSTSSREFRRGFRTGDRRGPSRPAAKRASLLSSDGGVIRGHSEERGIGRLPADVGQLVGGGAKPRVCVDALHQKVEVSGEPALAHASEFAIVAD